MQTWECIQSYWGHVKSNSAWVLYLWTHKCCLQVGQKVFQPLLFQKSSWFYFRSKKHYAFSIGHFYNFIQAINVPFFRSSTGELFFWIFWAEKGLLPKNFGSMKDSEVTDFVHTFRDFHILSDIDLVKLVFERYECDYLDGWCLSFIAAMTARGQKQLIDNFLAEFIVVVGGLLISL